MNQEFRAELALAATLHLLSSSVERGMTPAKTVALLEQLRILVAEENLDPVLRRTCSELMAQWRETQSRFGAIAQPLPAEVALGAFH
jgi:hypothetical protein